MNKLCVLIVLAILSGCASYSEPGYDTSDASHKYEGRYTHTQRVQDYDRNRTIAERQTQYDRHQNQVQNRVVRENAETRRNIVTGLAILGAGYGVYSLERSQRQRATQQRNDYLLRMRRLKGQE